MTEEKKQPNTPDEATEAGAPDIDAAAEGGEPAKPTEKAASGFAGGESGPDPLDVLKTENAELRERYVRLAADMENLRKRTEREKADMAKYAISDFARDIVSLSDNFQRAISAVSPEAAEKDDTLRSFLEGVEMNERELQKVLERHGVVRLDPQGEKFDPNMHQAVQQITNPELPHNTVCDVYQVGYLIAERVLRHAVVAVATGGPRDVPAKTAEQAETAPADTKAAGAAKDDKAATGETPTPADQTAEDPSTSDSDDVGQSVDKNV